MIGDDAADAAVISRPRTIARPVTDADPTGSCSATGILTDHLERWALAADRYTSRHRLWILPLWPLGQL